MVRELANLMPASGALPRTRHTRRDYTSLAEGPINSELLKNGMPLLSKVTARGCPVHLLSPIAGAQGKRCLMLSLASVSMLSGSYYHLQMHLCLHGHITSVSPEYSSPTERLSSAAAVAAETRKRRASASSSSDSDEPLVKRPRGRPPKNPLPRTVPVPNGTSADTGISPQFLIGGTHLLPAP